MMEEYSKKLDNMGVFSLNLKDVSPHSGNEWQEGA